MKEFIRITFGFLLLLMTVTVYAQDETGRLSAAEANILHKNLSCSKEDTTQINLLLQLAEFHTLKTGRAKSDLDTATTYIAKARRINSKSKLRKPKGIFYW